MTTNSINYVFFSIGGEWFGLETFKVYMTSNFLSPSWKDLLKQYILFIYSLFELCNQCDITMHNNFLKIHIAVVGR